MDNLFKGIHQDGTTFGYVSKSKEINDIAYQLKYSATLAFNRFEKTMEQIESSETSITKRYLVEGYQKYLQILKEEKAQVKTTGLDRCFSTSIGIF